jgi:uncharacterized protein YkwD
LRDLITQRLQRNLIPIFFLVMAIWGLLVIHPSGAASQDSAALERQVFALVNAHRATRGLTPLMYREEIAAVARDHSQAMATGRVGFNHEGVEVRRRELSKRIAFRQFAENVGVNNQTSALAAQTAVAEWLKSSGHRQNIEGRFDLTGVGIACTSTGLYFFTQIFVSSSRPRSGTSEG